MSVERSLTKKTLRFLI